TITRTSSSSTAADFLRVCGRTRRRSASRRCCRSSSTPCAPVATCRRPWQTGDARGVSRRPCVARSNRIRPWSWRPVDVSIPRTFRCAVLSALKHDYVARGMAAHGCFDLVVVADDPDIPEWGHERNQQLADAFRIPYVRDVERALRDFDVQVAIVSPEAERHVGLSVRAAQAGKHVVQDKPLATSRGDADRLVEVIERSRVKFLMWNRNFLPAVLHARDQIRAGAI